MALGTHVYNRAREKQIWLGYVERTLSKITHEPLKTYRRHDGMILTEHQIKDAYQRASHAVHSSPDTYQCGDGRALTKYDIKAVLRHAKKFPERISRKDIAATITDVEDFLGEERLWMCNAPEEPASGYKKLMAQTAPSGFAKPVEEKSLDQDFVLRFPEYELSGCFCMN